MQELEKIDEIQIVVSDLLGEVVNEKYQFSQLVAEELVLMPKVVEGNDGGNEILSSKVQSFKNPFNFVLEFSKDVSPCVGKLFLIENVENFSQSFLSRKKTFVAACTSDNKEEFVTFCHRQFNVFTSIEDLKLDETQTFAHVVEKNSDNKNKLNRLISSSKIQKINIEKKLELIKKMGPEGKAIFAEFMKNLKARNIDVKAENYHFMLNQIFDATFLRLSKNHEFFGKAEMTSLIGKHNSIMIETITFKKTDEKSAQSSKEKDGASKGGASKGDGGKKGPSKGGGKKKGGKKNGSPKANGKDNGKTDNQKSVFEEEFFETKSSQAKSSPLFSVLQKLSSNEVFLEETLQLDENVAKLDENNQPELQQVEPQLQQAQLQQAHQVEPQPEQKKPHEQNLSK